MTLREKIDVMEAFERGEEIECKYSGSGDWFTVECKNPEFRWEGDNYRIKPKQTVVIEKWLCKTKMETFIVIEGDANELNSRINLTKVKLLETYEVEL